MKASTPQRQVSQREHHLQKQMALQIISCFK